MIVQEIIETIEEFAPLSLQAGYDNAGLICGNPQSEITSVLLSTDITEDVVDEAIAGKHNLIISHHPLTLQGIKKIIPDNYINRCLIKAIKYGLNIYSAHTNIDSVANGVSGKMADKLGLVNREILQPEGKLFCLAFYTPATQAEKVRTAILDTGAGHIGNYSHCSFNTPGQDTFLAGTDTHPYCGETGHLHTEDEIKTEITVPEYLLDKSIATLIATHPYEKPVWNVVCINNLNPITGTGIIGDLQQQTTTGEFLQNVKKIFGCSVIRHTAICLSTVKRIALCGGAGASLTTLAMRRNADVYISGDFKYHDFFLSEKKIIIADIGHYESEQFTKEIFYELLTKKIPKFAVRFSEINTNPVNYLK